MGKVTAMDVTSPEVVAAAARSAEIGHVQALREVGRSRSNQRAKHKTETRPMRSQKLDWPGGQWSVPARNAFLALLTITGKPKLALDLMDELELWLDHRRPPADLVQRWAWLWRLGAITVKPKMMTMVQKQYDGLRRADMDDTLRYANAAHRTISKTVIDKEFDKETSGALQHLGQFVSIGTEKRQSAFDPRLKDQNIQVTPQFFLSAPPERRALEDGNTVDAEVKVIG